MQIKYTKTISKNYKEISEEFKKEQVIFAEKINLCKELGIKVNFVGVSIDELFNILQDEDRLKLILAKLKYKSLL